MESLGMMIGVMKIAVITGASGGLGKEFVRQIINNVDEVWAIGRNVAKLESEGGASVVEICWLINNAGAIYEVRRSTGCTAAGLTRCRLRTFVIRFLFYEFPHIFN